MVFLPREPERAAQARAFCDESATTLGLRPLGWRVVPANHEVLGPLARSNAPQIEQWLLGADVQLLLPLAEQLLELRPAVWVSSRLRSTARVGFD